MRRFAQYLLLGLLACLLVPAWAVAQAPPPQHTLALPTDQVWVLVAGAVVPAGAYMLNHLGPWVTEPVKAAVHLLLAAVAGGIMQAVTAGDVGFNDTTLQFVCSAVVAALAAHKFFWQPSGLAGALGGGSNAQDDPAQ